jgi:hypothetical protein
MIDKILFKPSGAFSWQALTQETLFRNGDQIKTPEDVSINLEMLVSPYNQINIQPDSLFTLKVEKGSKGDIRIIPQQVSSQDEGIEKELKNEEVEKTQGQKKVQVKTKTILKTVSFLEQKLWWITPVKKEWIIDASHLSHILLSWSYSFDEEFSVKIHNTVTGYQQEYMTKKGLISSPFVDSGSYEIFIEGVKSQRKLNMKTRVTILPQLKIVRLPSKNQDQGNSGSLNPEEQHKNSSELRSLRKDNENSVSNSNIILELPKNENQRFNSQNIEWIELLVKNSRNQEKFYKVSPKTTNIQKILLPDFSGQTVLLQSRFGYKGSSVSSEWGSPEILEVKQKEPDPWILDRFQPPSKVLWTQNQCHEKIAVPFFDDHWYRLKVTFENKNQQHHFWIPSNKNKSFCPQLPSDSYQYQFSLESKSTNKNIKVSSFYPLNVEHQPHIIEKYHAVQPIQDQRGLPIPLVIPSLVGPSPDLKIAQESQFKQETQNLQEKLQNLEDPVPPTKLENLEQQELSMKVRDPEAQTIQEESIAQVNKETTVVARNPSQNRIDPNMTLKSYSKVLTPSWPHWLWVQLQWFSSESFESYQVQWSPHPDFNQEVQSKIVRSNQDFLMLPSQKIWYFRVKGLSASKQDSYWSQTGFVTAELIGSKEPQVIHQSTPQLHHLTESYKVDLILD